jgi:hypothetical protein
VFRGAMRQVMTEELSLTLVLKTVADKAILFRYTSCRASPRLVHLVEVGKFTVMPRHRQFTLQQNFHTKDITRMGLIPD